jgi:hypothetical protein
MPSPNPGISAAGEAAGRTALNPNAGPAAIGGMLVPGEEPEVERSGETTLQIRLSSAVSDITKLANAMVALSLGGRRAPEAAPTPVHNGWRDDGSPVPAAGDGGGETNAGRPPGFTTISGESGTMSGYAARPGAAVESNRQVASYYRN